MYLGNWPKSSKRLETRISSRASPIDNRHKRIYALRRNEQPDHVSLNFTHSIHTDSKTCLTTGGLAQDLSAAAAKDNRLGVREDSGNGEAARALHVHEERVRALNQTLQLVGAQLLLLRRVNEVDSESLQC